MRAAPPAAIRAGRHAKDVRGTRYQHVAVCKGTGVVDPQGELDRCRVDEMKCNCVPCLHHSEFHGVRNLIADLAVRSKDGIAFPMCYLQRRVSTDSVRVEGTRLDAFVCIDIKNGYVEGLHFHRVVRAMLHEGNLQCHRCVCLHSNLRRSGECRACLVAWRGIIW